MIFRFPVEKDDVPIVSSRWRRTRTGRRASRWTKAYTWPPFCPIGQIYCRRGESEKQSKRQNERKGGVSTHKGKVTIPITCPTEIIDEKAESVEALKILSPVLGSMVLPMASIKPSLAMMLPLMPICKHVRQQRIIVVFLKRRRTW